MNSPNFEFTISELTREAISLAIREDIGSGDVTGKATLTETADGSAYFLVKDSTPSGITICGQCAIPEILSQIDSKLSYHTSTPDGSIFKRGDKFGKVSGPVGSILAAERVCLNILQRLSGISTYTRQFVAALNGTNTKILDTRKTDPCWRELSKFAVKVGGGENHRVGLYDMFLIKNNHIDALNGDVALAIARCRKLRPDLKIEVEVRDKGELVAALKESPHIILLDNFSLADLPEAIEIIRLDPNGAGVKIEYSGGAQLETVRQIAETGVDYISVGALTHSYPNIDISLRIG